MRPKYGFRISSLLLLLSVFIIGASIGQNVPCSPRLIPDHSVVCVCNATYCDTLEPLPEIPDGEFYHLVSSFAGKRFETSFENLTDLPVDESVAELIVYADVKYQSMIGFGGAFTDAAGQNFESISPELKDRLMRAYFAPEGLEYNIARIPVGGSDFSSRPYAYCNDAVGDIDLECFALEREDTTLKIPYVKEGQALNPNLKLFASAWSAPAWMKTNNRLNGTGFLKPEYYETWANYYIRFLEEYEKHDITFWALTTQNEPIHGIIGGGWNCMGWWPDQQRDFIKNNLGPKLRANYPDVKLIILDDQRFQVVLWLNVILTDPEAAQYVDGVGLHWYANHYFPPTPLDVAHNKFPEYFMLNTEACTGYLHELPGVEPVDLGSWYRAELYAHNIIEDLNHWLSGWVEWNLVLDQTGGPNWAGNMVDAPIIVNSVDDEAYKEPMYYALGHFTKYISEHSVRVHSVGTRMQSLQTLTVLRPDGSVVVVILNDKTENDVDLTIRDQETGTALKVTVGSRSIHTIVYGGNAGFSTEAPPTTPTRPTVSTASTDTDSPTSTFPSATSTEDEPTSTGGSSSKMVSAFLAALTPFIFLVLHSMH